MIFPRGGRANIGGEVKMAMQDDCNFDLNGLQVIYVNKYFSKSLDDGSVLTVCGFKNGNIFTPLVAIINPLSIAVEDGTNYMDKVMSCLREMH